MGGNKIKDMVIDASVSATESGIETLTDNLPVLAEVAEKAGLEGAASALADSVIGAVAPGVLGFVMNYKLRRAERNVGKLILELSENMEEVNRRLVSLEAEKQDKFVKGTYLASLLDVIADESEASKIQGAINAFVNFMGGNAGDSFVLTFFDLDPADWTLELNPGKTWRRARRGRVRNEEGHVHRGRAVLPQVA